MITSSLHKLFLTTLVALTALAAMPAQAATTPLDSVAIIVNSSVITQSQLNQAIIRLRAEMQSTGQPVPSNAELRQKAIDQLVGEALQLQVAQRAKIDVSDAQVSEAISRIAQQNKISVDQLKQELGKQGISYTAFRKQIHDQITLHQIQQQALGGKVQLSDAEVRAYMNNPGKSGNAATQYHVADLLIPLPESPSSRELADANKKANDLVKQARNQVPLSQLKKHNVNNNLEYNDLDWRTQKELPNLFASSVANMQAGDVAGPIRAPNGLHIIQLLEVRGNASALTFEQAKQMLLQKKFQEQAAKWVQEMKKTAYIKIN
jgi:peptidyl-prolyl cis-trans isomerase SurA